MKLRRTKLIYLACFFILFCKRSLSQDATTRLKVYQIEARTKEKNNWTEWSNVPTKTESYLIINNSSKTLIWEEKAKVSSYTEYHIIKNTIDDSKKDLLGIYIINYVVKKDNAELGFQMSYFSSEKIPYYLLITYTQPNSNLQFRYHLVE